MGNDPELQETPDPTTRPRRGIRLADLRAASEGREDAMPNIAGMLAAFWKTTVAACFWKVGNIQFARLLATWREKSGRLTTSSRLLSIAAESRGLGGQVQRELLLADARTMAAVYKRRAGYSMRLDNALATAEIHAIRSRAVHPTATSHTARSNA